MIICSLGKHKMDYIDDDIISEHDEFECSECDFKCPNESEMIQHSATHQDLGDSNDKPDDSIAENISTELNNKKEFLACITSTDSGTDGPGHTKPIVKREPSPYDDNVIAVDNYESKDWNKKKKIEDKDILTTAYSANQINEYDNLQQGPSYLDLTLPKTEHTDLSETKYSISKNSDIFKECGGLALHTTERPYQHPPYAIMVASAIKVLNKRIGSSRCAILKYILANYKVGDATKVRVHVRLAMRRMLANKKIVPAKRRFKLAKEENATKPNKLSKKPYHCSQCDKAFSHNCDLTSHMRVIHPPSPLPPKSPVLPLEALPENPSPEKIHTLPKMLLRLLPHNSTGKTENYVQNPSILDTKAQSTNVPWHFTRLK